MQTKLLLLNGKKPNPQRFFADNTSGATASDRRAPTPPLSPPLPLDSGQTQLPLELKP